MARIYDPENPTHRRELAEAVLETVTKAGFIEEWHGDAGDITKERTFYRPVDGTPNVRIVVYTSVVGREDPTVRTVGKDAIRVCALYRSERTDKEHGIVSETRVHRTGTIDATCDRLLDRMRKVWTAAKRPHRCSKCGAPTFKSKAGNDVCADLCWKTADELSEQEAQRRHTNRPHRYNGRRHRRWY